MGAKLNQRASRLTLAYLEGDEQSLEELDALVEKLGPLPCVKGAYGICVEHGQALSDCEKDL